MEEEKQVCWTAGGVNAGAGAAVRGHGSCGSGEGGKDAGAGFESSLSTPGLPDPTLAALSAGAVSLVAVNRKL